MLDSWILLSTRCKPEATQRQPAPDWKFAQIVTSVCSVNREETLFFFPWISCLAFSHVVCTGTVIRALGIRSMTVNWTHVGVSIVRELPYHRLQVDNPSTATLKPVLDHQIRVAEDLTSVSLPTLVTSRWLMSSFFSVTPVGRGMSYFRPDDGIPCCQRI